MRALNGKHEGFSSQNGDFLQNKVVGLPETAEIGLEL
jgi:hypothetical protein